ncbi:hypothetical protein [uncultured Thermus sp.]|nr:hypothetical protein [uncultured Thermus sp.]
MDALLAPGGLASLGTGRNPGEAGLEERGQWRLKPQGLSRALVYRREDP